jgi:hypothetical protein
LARDDNNTDFLAAITTGLIVDLMLNRRWRIRRSSGLPDMAEAALR